MEFLERVLLLSTSMEYLPHILYGIIFLTTVEEILLHDSKFICGPYYINMVFTTEVRCWSLFAYSFLDWVSYYQLC